MDDFLGAITSESLYRPRPPSLVARLGSTAFRHWRWLVAAAIAAPILSFAVVGVQCYTYRRPMEPLAAALEQEFPAFPKTRVLKSYRWSGVDKEPKTFGPQRYSLDWEGALVLDLADLTGADVNEICEFYARHVGQCGFDFKYRGRGGGWERGLMWWWFQEGNPPAITDSDGSVRGRTIVYISGSGRLTVRCLVQDIDEAGFARDVRFMPPSDGSSDVKGKRVAMVRVQLFDTGFTEKPKPGPGPSPTN